MFLAIYALNKLRLLRASSRKEDVLLAIAELVFSISKASEQLATTLTGVERSLSLAMLAITLAVKYEFHLNLIITEKFGLVSKDLLPPQQTDT